MLNLPDPIMTFIEPFRPHFHTKTWQKVYVLLAGAILATGNRTVTAILRVMGLSHRNDFSIYHHVLNRAVWSARDMSQTLLSLLLSRWPVDQNTPLVFGIDETIERRWGAKISKRGIYRDPVRSSHSHFVKASGLRWISLMWLRENRWAARIWALPFFTVLAPSERYYQQRGRSHKKLTDWARQMLYQLRRWLPNRPLVVVADYSYSVLEWLHTIQSMNQPITIVTRLRLDAALYDPAPPRMRGDMGRPRKKGARQTKLKTLLDDPKTKWNTFELDWYDGQKRVMNYLSHTAVWYHSGKPLVPLRWILIQDPSGRYDPAALLSTSLDYTPLQIATWFVQRWTVEVTFQEVRAHLGVETQRQWSDKAIERVTPLLLGLFSWITLVADEFNRTKPIRPRQAAWYVKDRPTFSDALAVVRQSIWLPASLFSMSYSEPDIEKVPSDLLQRLLNTVCYST